MEVPTSFIHRHLDPGESFGEIVFGLIMVLVFTLGAALASGHERGLILAAIGCNVAWGAIDGVLYALSSRFARRRRGRLVRAIHAAPDEATAIAAIRDELEPGLMILAKPEDLDRLYRSVHVLLARAEPVPMTVGREDWMAGIAVFVLVTATAVPAALPFLIFDDLQLALRVSNALLVLLLFLVGHRWAKYIDLNPWRAGLLLTLIGMALVALAIVLGG